MLRMETRCPSKETTFNLFPVISNNSPDKILILSLSAMEKMVWRMVSLKVNWEITIGWCLWIIGMFGKSSPLLPTISNRAFSQVITACNLSEVSIVTSLFGSLLTTSCKKCASKAMIPLSSTLPSMTVSIAISISFATNFILSEEASIRMHSKIAMVVLLGTALETMLTPFDNSACEQTIFMLWKTPFPCLYINKYIKNN